MFCSSDKVREDKGSCRRENIAPPPRRSLIREKGAADQVEVGGQRGKSMFLKRDKRDKSYPVFLKSFHPSYRETLSCVNSRLSEFESDPGSSPASPASAATPRLSLG